MKWPSYKLLTWVITFLFIAIVALYVFEIRALDNTIDSSDLLMKGSLVGLAIGISCGIFFQSKNKSKEAVPTFRLWLTCLLVPLIFAPMIGSLLNRKLSRKPILLQVEFLEEKPILSSEIKLKDPHQIRPSGYYLFVFISGKLERFTSEDMLFPNSTQGETVYLELRKGALGYDFLER